VLIPYQLAFEHEVDLLGSVVVYAIDLVFLADIALNFRTTVRLGGSEIEKRSLIRRHYSRNMLPIDLLATIPFDLVFLLVPDPGPGVVSIVLSLRLLRLLRVVRLFVIFDRWMRLSSTNSGYLRIVRLGTVIMLLIHWISCAWFFVPFLEHFPADSWVASEELQDKTPATQYVRSLYWTVVTMTTVGYGDITPSRNLEYVFTILVMLAGASLYAFIIGNIASLLSNLDSAKVAFWSRADAVNQYLRSRNVSPALNEHIRNYYEYLWDRYHGLGNNETFSELPVSVRLEILHILTDELLEGFPLFQEAPPALKNELLLALEPRVFAPGDKLLWEGEVGAEIVFLSRGSAEIVSKEGAMRHGEMGPGDYFGDLSMLLDERRTGSVIATTFCEAFVLTHQDFEHIKSAHPEFRELIVKASSKRTARAADLLLHNVVL
jgi:hypothetical protein